MALRMTMSLRMAAVSASFLAFAGGDQAQVEGAQGRGVPDRDQGGHVERRRADSEAKAQLT
jgi:hypothetical protein